jgi:hypothetical protein
MKLNFILTVKTYLSSTTTQEMSLTAADASWDAPGVRSPLDLTTRYQSSERIVDTVFYDRSVNVLPHTFGAPCYLSPVHLIITQLQGLPHLGRAINRFCHPNTSSKYRGRVVTCTNSTRDTAQPETAHIPVGGHLSRQPRRERVLIWQINTPLLERHSLILLFDLSFSLVNLTKFILRTEGYGWSLCPGFFQRGRCLHRHRISRTRYWETHYPCRLRTPRWQLDSATRVYTALGKAMSTVEDLKLEIGCRQIGRIRSTTCYGTSFCCHPSA